MCTCVISIDPTARDPVLILFTRDEFLDRSWIGPGPHWAPRPYAIGGQDCEAGGTWVAITQKEGCPRAAMLLNAPGRPCGEPDRRSRGELPLLALSDEAPEPDSDELRAFDPFHLIVADMAGAQMMSWDGLRASTQPLGPGLHFATNYGLGSAEGEWVAPRVAHFGPRFQTQPRPAPAGAVTGTAQAWDGWFDLANGDLLEPTDSRALVVRQARSGRPWGTSSVSLIALGPNGLRYDFTTCPGGKHAWYQVRTNAEASASRAV
ncbi:NRDE family protein [Streptomyces sp. SID13031]|nr:NRDE family protein [Streptomyces sp. SID13031]